MELEHPPPLPIKEKTILIRALRVAQPEQAQNCKSRPPMTTAWFIIQHTDEGPKISEIFHDIPQDKPDDFVRGSSCAIIGSSLYVIGGLKPRFNDLSNRVCRLDIDNPAAGWKTSEMSFCCANASATVSGNLIYLFSRCRFASAASSKYNYTDDDICGLVYDPVKQDAFPIKPPPNCAGRNPAFCIAVDGGLGVLVPMIEQNRQIFYHHDAHHSSWEQLHNYAPFCSESLYQYCISNGILYSCEYSLLSNTVDLCGYDIKDGGLLFKIHLPQFYGLYVHSFLSIVPIADFKLWLLWHINVGGEDRFALCYAELMVSLNPSPAIYILKEGQLKIDAAQLLTCLSFDFYPGQNKGNPLSFSEVVLASGNKMLPKLTEEVDWKKCCLDLLEQKWRVEEMLLSFRQHLKAFKLMKQLEGQPMMSLKCCNQYPVFPRDIKGNRSKTAQIVENKPRNAVIPWRFFMCNTSLTAQITLDTETIGAPSVEVTEEKPDAAQSEKLKAVRLKKGKLKEHQSENFEGIDALSEDMECLTVGAVNCCIERVCFGSSSYYTKWQERRKEGEEKDKRRERRRMERQKRKAGGSEKENKWIDILRLPNYSNRLNNYFF